MKQNKIVIIASFLYMVIVSAFMIYHRIWFSPDQFFIFAILGSLILGRTKIFIIDWGPFLLLFLGYEFLRSLAPFVIGRAHIFPMILVDKFMFGSIPSVTLQNALYNSSNLKWYDYLTVILYISHFVIPMCVGYLFWLRSRKIFKNYSLTILVVSYMAFLTFLIFPAMPPWMAANKGYIPEVKEIISGVMSHFASSFNLPTVYAILGADPVAAVPSLHAAFPVIIFLFVFKLSKKLSILAFIYIVGVWFSIVYLGEHYFVDALIGALYAIVGFMIVEKKAFIFSTFKKLGSYYKSFRV